MIRLKSIKPIPVTYIPERALMKEGEIYLSNEYMTAAHLCCCGCGEEVVTPLNAAKWQLKLSDGRVSLYPSIGNWEYQCRSHYIIRDNKIIWMSTYSADEIREVQLNDQRAVDFLISQGQDHKPTGLLDNIKRWIKSIFNKAFR